MHQQGVSITILLNEVFLNSKAEKTLEYNTKYILSKKISDLLTIKCLTNKCYEDSSIKLDWGEFSNSLTKDYDIIIFFIDDTLENNLFYSLIKSFKGKIPIIVENSKIYVKSNNGSKHNVNMLLDKDDSILASSGLLKNMNTFNQLGIDKYLYVPKVNTFSILLKGMLICIQINLVLYNLLKQRKNLDKTNQNYLSSSFLKNLVYLQNGFYSNFCEDIIKDLDNKGYLPMFDKEHYNFYKTKDNKYISIGNLEPKFQESFSKHFEKMTGLKSNNIDYEKINLEISKLEFSNIITEKTISDNCISPVLSIKEADEILKSIQNDLLKLSNKLISNEDYISLIKFICSCQNPNTIFGISSTVNDIKQKF